MRCPALCTFLLALAVSTAPVAAQETFAPLITENTALFVHIDLRKVEINDIKQSWTTYAGELLTTLKFDAISTRSTLTAINRDLNRLDEFVRPTYETITQTLGIREIALIVDTDFDSDTIPLIIAVPWKGKTNNDFLMLEELAAEGILFLDNLNYTLVPKGDFLFLAPGNVESLTAWLDGLKPSETGIMQAMKALGNDEIKVALAMTDILRERLLDELRSNSAFPEPMSNILLNLARKIDWAAASFPNPLMAGKHEPYKMTVKTLTESDARQLRTMLEAGIDMAITAWQGYMVMMQEFSRDFGGSAMPEMPQTVYEFSRGYLRTMLPVVEGDKMVFQQPVTEPFVELAIYAAAAPTLFFWIDAMRWELERPMPSCENNMRQIVLAIHMYHDVYNGFPPLYTVDAEGKPLHSWRTLILPFIEQNALYEEMMSVGAFNEPWDSELNKQFHNRIIPVYVCPKGEVEGDKNCHYSAIVGGGFLPAKNVREMTGANFSRLTDGTSNTLAVVEVKEAFCWMDPTADVTLEELVKGINAEGGRVGSNHRGGANAAWFDGSTLFLSDDTPAEFLRIMGLPDSGEAVPREWRGR